MKQGYRIISIEAADIYRHEQKNGVSVGYKMPENKSDAYFRLFKIYLDNSLDLVELEKAYKRICRKKFSFQDKNENEYTLAVINLKFNYTYKPENGKESILFTPPAPYETPDAIEKICNEFNIAISKCEVDPLILIPIFIHDFLCIHPFSDGNGRMSRLLTTLLLYRNGYMVGKYISLESKIAKNKNAYYDALEKAQAGWNEGKEDPVPFIKYLLGTIISAYRDFEDRMEIVSESESALDMVKKAVANKIGKFTKMDIVAMCPSLSNSSVESSLKKLAQEGIIEKKGASRATYYVKIEKI